MESLVQVFWDGSGFHVVGKQVDLVGAQQVKKLLLVVGQVHPLAAVDLAEQQHHVGHAHGKGYVGALVHAVDELNCGKGAYARDVDGVFLHPAQQFFDGVALRVEAEFLCGIGVVSLKGEGGVRFVDIHEEVHDLGEAEGLDLGIGRRIGKRDAHHAVGPEFLRGFCVIGIISDVHIAPDRHVHERGLVDLVSQALQVGQAEDWPGIQETQLGQGGPAAGEGGFADPGDTLLGVLLRDDVAVGVHRAGQEDISLQVDDLGDFIGYDLVRADLDDGLVKEHIHPFQGDRGCG